jgi:hypothetical protein
MLSRLKGDEAQAAHANGESTNDEQLERASVAIRFGVVSRRNTGRFGTMSAYGLRRLLNWYQRLASEWPWCVSIATVATLVASVFLLLTPGFDTNDDVVINMIVAGKGFGLAPDEHMVFTHVWIGQVLKAAYTHFPDVPWYASYLLIVQAMANVVLLYCAIESGFTWLRLRLYLLYFLTAGLFFIHNLQFTSTAFMAGQSGILLLLLAAARSDRRESRWRIYRPVAAALALLIFASLVRREVFYPLLVLGLATCGIYATFTLRRTANLARSGAVLLTALLAAVIAWRANDAYYQADPGWQDFHAYNRLRVKFNDEAWVTFSERTAKAFSEVGWSENDLAMLRAWFYDDKERYSYENLQKVMAAHPWYLERLSWPMFAESIEQVLGDRITLAILLALPIMVYCVERRRVNFWLIGASCGIVCVLILFLILVQKSPPSRVYAPMLAFPMALCAVLARRRDGFMPTRDKVVNMWVEVTRGDGWRRAFLMPLGNVAVVTLVVLMGISMFQGVYPQYRSSRARMKASVQLYELLEKLSPSDDKLFVCWAASFPFEAIPPFESLKRLGNTHLLVVGWPQHTPPYRAMKERFGIGDLAEALHRRSDLYLVAHPTYLKVFRRYVLEHFDTPILYHTRQNDRLFDVFQVSARGENKQVRMTKDERRQAEEETRR